MAYLNKDEYARRERAADRRMARNAEIETLTPEQHNALSELCRVRHDIHGPNTARDLFYGDMWEYIDTANHDNLITELLESASLPPLDWSCDACNYPCEEDREINDIPDEEWDEYVEESIDTLSDLIEQWNTAVEKYLKAIDNEHGTSYCPTGTFRI